MFYKPKPQTKVVISSSRQYAQPKLKKPKELKGVKQSFSVDWIYKKCRCSCFINGNDLWIKHRDFNSIDVYELENKKNKKFIYNDNFGCIVLRGEAWILLRDFVLDIENNVFTHSLVWSLAEQITGEVGCGEWERFFEKVIMEYGRYSKEN